MSPTTLPDAVLGQPYQAQLTATNGTAPFRWSATGLPPGLLLDPGTGLLSGTPNAAGSLDVGVITTDPTSRRGWVGLHLTVAP